MTYETIFKKSKGFTIPGRYHMVKLTPEFAGKLLKHNNRNRPIRQSRIAKLSTAMRLGKWKYNGDAVRIDKNGNLLDFQHRLLAILKSDTPIIADIVTGLDIDVFETIDIPQVRTGGDVFSMYNIKNANTVAAGVKLVLNIEDGNIGLRASYDNQAMSDFAKKRGPNEMRKLEKYAALGQKYRKYLGSNVSPGHYCGLLYIMAKDDEEKPLAFFDELCNMLEKGHTKNTPVRTLWEKLYWNPSAAKSIPREKRIVFIIKAYLAWLENKPLKVLRWSESEGIPKI